MILDDQSKFLRQTPLAKLADRRHQTLPWVQHQGQRCLRLQQRRPSHSGCRCQGHQGLFKHQLQTNGTNLTHYITKKFWRSKRAKWRWNIACESVLIWSNTYIHRWIIFFIGHSERHKSFLYFCAYYYLYKIPDILISPRIDDLFPVPVKRPQRPRPRSDLVLRRPHVGLLRRRRRSLSVGRGGGGDEDARGRHQIMVGNICPFYEPM